MKRLGSTLLFVAACTQPSTGTPSPEAGGLATQPEAGLRAAQPDAAVDLVALQVDLGRRVDAADRALASLGDGAKKRAATTAGDAAKLQIALLETPAAAPTDAEARVGEFERAVAAAK